MVHDIWLGMLESLLNSFIDIDSETHAQVREHAGLIVRCKAANPHVVFYLHFTEEGIELSTRSPGPAKIRIGGNMVAMAGALLGGESLERPGRLHIWGDSEQVAWLTELLRNFNLRTSAQRWLKDHLNLGDVMSKISRHDPGWITDLMPMPGMMREALSEIRTLRQQLEQQQELWRQQQLAWQSQRRWDLGMLVLILSVLVLALLPGATLPERLQGLTREHLLWLALALSLIGTRFWRR